MLSGIAFPRRAVNRALRRKILRREKNLRFFSQKKSSVSLTEANEFCTLGAFDS
jgi:hypothetical protein